MQHSDAEILRLHELDWSLEPPAGRSRRDGARRTRRTMDWVFREMPRCVAPWVPSHTVVNGSRSASPK